MDQQSTKSLRVMRIPAAAQKVGFSRTSIYNRINPKSPAFDPSFPKPIDLGTGKNPPIGFIEHELDEWIAKQAAKSRSSAGK